MRLTNLIDAAALQARLREIVVLDCRFDLAAPDAGRAAYRRGHIPAARYLDLNRDLSSPVSASTGRHPLPDPQRLLGRLIAFGIGPDTPTVAYDESNGSFAARAWWLLRWLGARNAAVLDGGLKAWTSRQGTLETGEPSDGDAAPAEARARAEWASVPPPDPGAAVVTGEELERLLENPGRLLVDARAPERFSGAVEPIDPVAGHVPGALNHPFAENLREDGRFLPPQELKERWLRRLGGKDPRDVIAMCGSGVTACHNLLALELAGLSGAKLYAGSWSEWIRDPARRVARG
jgi:thiosulfate/3-mercaptopyruvate sulfurtransferase